MSQTREQYVENLKTAAVTLGARTVVPNLAAKAPFLAWPIVGAILSLIVQKILEVAIRETEFGAFFQFIDLRTSKQGRDFEAAAIKNREVQARGTEKEKADAEKMLIARFRDFARFTS